MDLGGHQLLDRQAGDGHRLVPLRPPTWRFAWGQFDLDFDSRGELDHSCNGHNAKRPVANSGDFIFRTGSPYFGDITEAHDRGTLRRFDGSCPLAPSPCPDDGRVVDLAIYGTNGALDRLYVEEANGADVARRTFEWVRGLDPTISHRIDEVVPEQEVDIANDVSSAEIVGVPALFSAGSAQVEGSGEAFDSSADCGRNGRIDYRSRSSVVTGDLIGDMQGFRDWRIRDESGWAAWLRKLNVGPR